MENVAPTVEDRNIDDLGASYLKFRGNYKRHTVHGSDDQMNSGGGVVDAQFQSSMGSAPTSGRQYSPLDNYCGGRYVRGNPSTFRQSATTRRGSDSTQLTPDMLRHLGKLYCTATTQRVKVCFCSEFKSLNYFFFSSHFFSVRKHAPVAAGIYTAAGQYGAHSATVISDKVQKSLTIF